MSASGVTKEFTRKGNRTDRRGHGPEPRRYFYDGQCLTVNEWVNVTGFSRVTVVRRAAKGEPLARKTAAPASVAKAGPVVSEPTIIHRPVAAVGMKANTIRRRLESCVTTSGMRLKVDDVRMIGPDGWYQVETNDGTRYARWRADGRIDVQKTPPGMKEPVT